MSENEWIEFSMLTTGHFSLSKQTMQYETLDTRSLFQEGEEEHCMVCDAADRSTAHRLML